MENVQHDITESTPLLRSDTNSTASGSTGDSKARKSWWQTEWQRHFARWSTLYVCGLFILLVDVPNFMSEVPKLRMLELGLCRDYYAATDPSVIDRDGSVPERLCKVREIQSALAKMRGILGMIEGIPGLILAIPYGILADSKGRRLVTGLSLLGFVLRDLWAFVVLYFYQLFPVRAVYAAPAFLVLGGGSTVISPMIMAIIAAAVPEVSRTRAFFWVQVVLLITELIAPPLGAVLMKALGPHFAFLVAIPLEALAFVVLGFIPNTRSPHNTSNDNVDGEEEEEESQAAHNQGQESCNSQFSVSHMLQNTRRGFSTLGMQRGLWIGLLALVVAKMARPMLELILQYMSVRFGWPLSKTAFLLSIQAAGQILLFAVVLPQVNIWLLNRMKSSSATNLALTRVSVLFLAAGAFCMGFANSVPVFIIGTYTNKRVGELSSINYVAVFEGISTIGASPLLGLSFSVGLEIGGIALSLPFFIAAMLYALAVTLLLCGMSIGSDATET
ncbi:hypothetical protein F53441_4977 [Fusarium austroafricanum]|uniref:Major facilitator superfamily (MFS) profile domain-containing protein n=1 Tax=Fusarium austroafricanum TaxID=2364996 RepID=A0A8H4KMQ4_9HYPO|nr:hypothetical protein F53441_4977 [Fusarium austroafricanum]